MMIGTYIKHNDNDGNIETAEQVLPVESCSLRALYRHLIAAVKLILS